MSNFGFAHLRLITPYDLAFKEARSAVRSHYILEQAQVFDTLGPAIADCSLVVGSTAIGHRDLRVPLYSLPDAAPLVHTALDSGPVALLFGSEKFGLSNDDMSHCHWLLRIPTRHEHGSMNLGQAVAVCLYELRRTAGGASSAPAHFPAPPAASSGNYELFTTLLLDLLNRSGYVNSSTSKSTELKIRRLVRRLGLPASDTETWLGILRQILWKIAQSKSL